MSETFQSVVYSGVEAESEAIHDLLSEVGHQLQGADAHGHRHADGDDGYVAQAESVLHDDAAVVEEILGTASGKIQDVESDMNDVLRDDDDAAKDLLGEILGKSQGDEPGADQHRAAARGTDAAAPRRPHTGNRYAESDAEAFYSTASDPQFLQPTDDGFLPYPYPSSGTSPVPVVQTGFTPPAPGSAGITLGDILSVVGETAQATTAVANAASIASYHPAVPVGVGVPVVGVGYVPTYGPEGWGPSDGDMHRHGVGRFAHERPVIFLLAFAAILYFLFLSEDSVWEKVLHSGTKSKKHDKVETFTEEIHTKRESVLGKPTFPAPVAAS